MIKAIVLGAFALLAAPAAAQSTPTTSPQVQSVAPAAPVVPGATVYGPQNDVVGTILRIENGVATIETGTHEVPVPLGSLRPGVIGPILPVSRLQLHQLVEQHLAERAARRDAALVAGANVLTADNQPLGTVEAVGSDNVVIRRGGTQRIALARQYFLADDGTLRTRMTLQDIDSAAVR